MMFADHIPMLLMLILIVAEELLTGPSLPQAVPTGI